MAPTLVKFIYALHLAVVNQCSIAAAEHRGTKVHRCLSKDLKNAYSIKHVTFKPQGILAAPLN